VETFAVHQSIGRKVAKNKKRIWRIRFWGKKEEEESDWTGTIPYPLVTGRKN